MNIIEFQGDTLRFLDAVPNELAEGSLIWIFLEQEHFERERASVQDACMRLGGSALLDLHCQDLANAAHPSHYDYTSVYDLIVFRRLATPVEVGQDCESEHRSKSGKSSPLSVLADRIRSRAVGFAVFDRLLISVHPKGCYAARSFVDRFLADAKFNVDATPSASNGARTRLPTSPTDLVLRMINVMVDSYLNLRKDLSSQLDHWQEALLKPNTSFNNWKALMGARNQLHTLEDLCEEQRDAMQEWLDSLREQPVATTEFERSQRDQLIARARDVLEHIERVVHHVRRLEQSAETVVQIHFSAQGNRTNDIMRTLTALTAIFLPLNLIAGIFGMNFDNAPFIHSSNGFWWSLVAMCTVAATMGLVFWRKRYLARTRP